MRKRMGVPKMKGGARLSTPAERNAIARNIQSKTNAWAKKTLKGV